MAVPFLVLLIIALTKTIKEKFNPRLLAFITCCMLLVLLAAGWLTS